MPMGCSINPEYWNDGFVCFGGEIANKGIVISILNNNGMS
jgi:hypothetical protein